MRTPKNLDGQPARPAAGRPLVAITEAVVGQSQAMLRAGGWSPTERIVYWAGVKREGLWLATTVLRPKAVLTRGSFRTSSEANAEVVSFLADNGLAFVGQVHTHPGRLVGHSDGDERDAFMPSENTVSLVVPVYGREGMLPLHMCGVHRFEGGDFRRLPDEEVVRTFCIVPAVKDFEGAS